MNPGLFLLVAAAASTLNVQSALDKIRVEQDVPGVAVVVTRRKNLLFAGASGVADLESGRVMTADTTLYAGSLSKILTAVLTLRLVEDGVLSLAGTAKQIKPCAPAVERCITVRDLLTHTSGLDREGDFDYWFNAEFPNKAALLEYLLNAKLLAQPGQSTSYSNIAYAALGIVIEQSSGQSYEAALSNLVLRPLGMNSSGITQPGSNLSVGYSPSNRVLPNQARPFAGLGRRVGNRRVREYHNARAMAPAFGAFTTAQDLSRLARFLLGYSDNAVLSDESRSQILKAQSGGRGLGIRLAKYKGRSVARHGGWFAAHQSHILLDTESGITIVVLANSDSASPGKIAEVLLDDVLEFTKKEAARHEALSRYDRR